jgi:hypothetical protein
MSRRPADSAVKPVREIIVMGSEGRRAMSSPPASERIFFANYSGRERDDDEAYTSVYLCVVSSDY